MASFTSADKMHLSPQLASEFHRVHQRFDRIESLIATLLTATPIAPAPSIFSKSTLSPLSEAFVPMNAKKVVPIINPTTNTPVVPEKESASSAPEVTSKSLPSKDLGLPVIDVTPTSSQQVCLFCNRKFMSSRRVLNNKDIQKFCTNVCKTTFRKQQKTTWNPLETTNVVSPFIPLLDRTGVEFIEGPAGTGKSKCALDICLTDQDKNVVYLTSSWIAAFEFAKKLTSVGLAPRIPACHGNLTEIALRARTKEFPEFRNPSLSTKHVTILIASMTHSTHFQSFKQPARVQNKKSGAFHPKREWEVNSSVPLGTRLMTLGQSLALPDTMIIDEAGTVLDSILQTLTVGVKRVVLLGDRYQRKPIVDKETADIYKPFQIMPVETNSFREAKSDRVTILTQGHRCPRDTYVLMSSFYGYNVVGIETPRNTLPAHVTDSVACPTIASLHPGEFTIDELQGQTCDGLIVRTRSQADLDFLRMHRESVLVAMSRHTTRFSWIDSSDKVHNISEFFTRFCKSRVPNNHPDLNLVSSRLIGKSPATNLPSSGQNLDSIPPKPSTIQPPSDRFVNNIGGVTDTNGSREKLPESLSSFPYQAKASVPEDRGVVPTFSDNLSVSPRLETDIPNLLPKHSLTRVDSPDEVATSADQKTRAYTSVNTSPGRGSTELEVEKLVEEPLKYIVEKSSDLVTSKPIQSKTVDGSKFQLKTPPAIIPTCKRSGCNYIGVCLSPEGYCLTHKLLRDQDLESDSDSSISDAPSISSSEKSVRPLIREFVLFNVPGTGIVSYKNPFLEISSGEDARKRCTGCASFYQERAQELHHLGKWKLCKECVEDRERKMKQHQPDESTLVFVRRIAPYLGSGLFPEISFCLICKEYQIDEQHPCVAAQAIPVYVPPMTKTEKKKMKTAQKKKK